MKKDVNTVNEIGGSSNSYERTVVINGHKIKGLIDTGSDCMLIRASVVAKYYMTVGSNIEWIRGPSHDK